MRSGRKAAASNFARRTGIGLVALAALLIGGTRGTQDAIANGDTRTLTFYHNNTKETVTVTFRRNGQYDSSGLEQLNWFLRDWRRDEPTRMDPRLFDTVWEVYREVGAGSPVHVNSGYRSPNTNAMLRRRSSAVAKNSQHMLGKAMDFYIPDASTERLRAIGMRLQNGGVGYYPNAYTPFVHLDVGSVRAWPRMTRDQLARIFPDGKTVHIPADGTPMARYEEARAEVLAKGGAVAGYTAYAEAEEGGGAAAPSRRRSLWATLFGGSDEDEDAEEIRTASRPGRAIIASRNTPDRNAYASDSATSVLMAYNNGSSVPQQPAPRAAPVQVARQEPDEQAIRSAAAALRDDPISPPPLPPVAPTRIAGLPSTIDTPTGPTLAWQQGASGQNGADMKIGRENTFAPMPPRRPDDNAAPSTTVLAYAPMPPVRPSTLAATNPIPGLPDARGTVDVTTTASINHPLPPPRPGARAIAVAAAGPVELPAKPNSAAKDKAAPAPSPLAANAALHMSFSSKPMGDLATNKFSGPSVKPLPVLR
ncbi:DUF882 domain-containing protein [Microvirga flavescens]|uniref:DUF882 domain-containing protein n=1 Tax=Microvirga flavescens TaxID=2249811 RepID=UPI000DD5A3B6|nr:DUF882 domain-containing protein [Microvirga flavescens]